MDVLKIIGIVALSTGSLFAHAQDKIHISGSTTVLPIMQQLTETYSKLNPDVVIELSGGGSGHGIKALIDGFSTIALSSRQIKEKEEKLATDNDLHLVEIPVAIDAIVPVIHPDNPVRNLSSEQLKNVFTGKIKNWSELGGESKQIVIVSRDTSSGTFEAWSDLAMKKERVSPRALLQASNGAVIQTVARNPNAIGYVGISYVNKHVKALDLNNVSACIDNVEKKQWPLARELYVYIEREAPDSTKKFIEYSLSKNGQKLVEKTGFVPIN